MTARADAVGADQDAHDRARSEVAADLLLLADLHQQALHRDTLLALWGRCYDGLLRLPAGSPAVRHALNAFCQSLTEVPTCFDAQTDDLLCSDHRRLQQLEAGFPLAEPSPHVTGNGTTSADEHAVSRWATGRGRDVQHWPQTGTQSLASRLRSLAYFIAADGASAPPASLVQVIENSLQPGLDRFAHEAGVRCQTRLYRELAHLTAAYTKALGDLLARNPTLDSIGAHRAAEQWSATGDHAVTLRSGFERRCSAQRARSVYPR